MTRVVLDASVLLSATVARADSPPSLLLYAVRSGEIEAVACEQLLGEVRKGLASTYFQDRVTIEEGAALLAMLHATALLLPDPVDPARVLRDRSDDYLVALADAAGAEAIVTGDRDLLDHEGLKPPALGARTACERFGSSVADTRRRESTAPTSSTARCEHAIAERSHQPPRAARHVSGDQISPRSTAHRARGRPGRASRRTLEFVHACTTKMATADAWRRRLRRWTFPR